MLTPLSAERLFHRAAYGGRTHGHGSTGNVPGFVHTSVRVSGPVGRDVPRDRFPPVGEHPRFVGSVVVGLGLGRWDAVEAVHEALGVVPVHPARGGVFEVGEGGQWPAAEPSIVRLHATRGTPLLPSRRLTVISSLAYCYHNTSCCSSRAIIPRPTTTIRIPVCNRRVAIAATGPGRRSGGCVGTRP